MSASEQVSRTVPVYHQMKHNKTEAEAKEINFALEQATQVQKGSTSIF